MEKPKRIHTQFLGVFALLFAIVSGSSQSIAPQQVKGIASAPITFEKTYDDSLDQVGLFVIETQVGYLVAGYTAANFGPAPSNDALLLHVDFSGNILWQKRYGGNQDDVFNVVTAVNDGDGFLAVGTTQSFDQVRKTFIVRTDGAGNVLWSRTFSNDPFEYEGLAVLNVPAEPNNDLKEGYVISGNTRRMAPPGGPAAIQPYALRITNDGATVWRWTYPDPNQVLGGQFLVNYYENGTLFASGTVLDAGCLININAATGDNVPNIRLYEGPNPEALFYLKPTLDDQLILSDQTDSPFGGAPTSQWVVKMTKGGFPVWSNVYFDPSGQNLRGRVETVSDGGYLLVPYNETEDPSNEAALVKIDPVGNIIWSYRYGGPGVDRFFRAQETTDGGFVAVGHIRTPGSIRNDIFLVKTDMDGLVDSCCRQVFDIKVEPFQFDLREEIREQILLPPPDTIPLTPPETKLVPMDFCAAPQPTLTETILLCPGETTVIGGNTYTAPDIVVVNLPGPGNDCDTLATYHLVLRPQVILDETIALCPGDSIVIDGVSYTAPATVVSTLPGIPPDCDTIITYHLVPAPQPVKTETYAICPGSSITVHGMTYTTPGTYNVVLPASTGCDTLLTLIITQLPVHTITLTCPPDITVQAGSGANSALVNYNIPTATSTCPGSTPTVMLLSGLPSGSMFPAGETEVCYTAFDPANCCSKPDTCCFTVMVETQPPCDDQTAGCIVFEEFDIKKDPMGNQIYRFRVTNNCPSKLIYVAFQVPNGIVAKAPANNSVYTAPSGREYVVRNPNFSPLYSIRFKPLADSISNGQSDIFEYTLPPQVCNSCILAIARVYPKVYYQAHLCCIMPTSFSTVSESELSNGESQAGISGIEEIESNRPFTLFPNPTDGTLFADLSPWQGMTVQILVFNNQGQQVQRLNLLADDSPQKIALPDGLPGGLYFCQVLPENGEKQVLRFVLQR